MKKDYIFILVIAGIALVVGIYVWSSGGGSQAKAIEEAKKYRPSGICTAVMTPAVHPSSGAQYTFSSGCLAPGWVAR
jgi:hypothetical protein